MDISQGQMADFLISDLFSQMFSIPLPSMGSLLSTEMGGIPRQSFSIFPSSTITSDDLYLIPQELPELVVNEMRTWCKADSIQSNIVKLVIKLWDLSGDEKIPSLQDIVAHFLKRPCICISSLTDEQKKEFVEHFLIYYGKLPSCFESHICIEYYQFHKTWPSPSELEYTLSRYSSLVQDPEEFHKKDKLHIPTSNLKYLEAIEMEEKDECNCALCQDEIKSGQKCFRLSPCNHTFHSHSENCLGTDSIMHWLKENRTCPVCRSEIIIHSKQKDAEKTDPSMP